MSVRGVRFCVVVDIPVPIGEGDPGKMIQEGYAGLLDRMSGNDWESTDEAWSLATGEMLSPVKLSQARLKVLEARSLPARRGN